MLLKVDAGKNTVLHIAVGKGHVDIVNSLISWLRNPGDVKQMINSQRSHGDTTLHIAAAQGLFERETGAAYTYIMVNNTSSEICVTAFRSLGNLWNTH